ncbi:hypothetical protein PTKIN_Ptkin05aG0199000 [Pterospermum kingtungense]
MSSEQTKKKAKVTRSVLSSAAEQICNHEDLLTEILVKLPAKSLIKFKLVSKQWRCLISSHRFCLYHTRSFPTKPSALFIDAYICSPPSEFCFFPLTHDCVRLPPFDFVDLPNVQILQSCAGLLLCVSDSFVRDRARRYFICNPTVRRFKMLSFPIERSSFVVNLAFDPIKSLHYKIVLVRTLKTEAPCQTMLDKPQWSIDIYSSETDSWSLSKIKFTPLKDMVYGSGVFFKGAIYWYYDCRELHYFDVENECLKTMPMPPVKKVKCHCFGEFGGYLRITVAYLPSALLSFSVFEMAEDRSYWYLKYSLNRSFLSLMPVPVKSYQLVCAIQLKEGDLLFAVDKDGEGISYNLKDGTSKRVHCPKFDRTRFRRLDHIWYLACHYTETLYCI